MKLRNLVIIKAVCEEMSMTHAAKLFGISQSSVSQVVKDAEEHYGVDFFVREGKKLYLTKAGQELLNYTNKLMIVHDEMEEVLANLREEQPLRVGMTEGGISTYITGRIGAWNTNEMKTSPRFLHGNKDALLNMVKEGQLDMAILPDRVDDPSVKTKILMTACYRKDKEKNNDLEAFLKYIK